MAEEKHYSVIGTNSTPYYVPFSQQPETVTTSKGYFYVQIYGAQAAFTAKWWTGAQNLSVLSQVNLHLGDNNEIGNQDIKSLLQTREIEKNNAVQLGFSPMLIDFVPARMKKISIAVEYIVNTKNYLKDIAGLISDKALVSTLSFAPGVGTVAKTIGGITEKLVASFMPNEERKPILQFTGEFDLASQGLKEGYYVILGSHTPKNPLPTGTLNLEVIDGGRLKNNGEEVTELSYVILKVGCVKAIRDRMLEKSAWANILRELKRIAQDYNDDPFAESAMEKKKEFWEKTFLPQLRDMQVMLKSDPNLLEEEIDMIYRAAYRECLDLITGKVAVAARGPVKPQADGWTPNMATDAAFLGIDDMEANDDRLKVYVQQLLKSRKTFKDMVK